METLDGLLIGKVQVDNRRSTNFLRAVFRYDTTQDWDCTDLHSERGMQTRARGSLRAKVAQIQSTCSRDHVGLYNRDAPSHDLCSRN